MSTHDPKNWPHGIIGEIALKEQMRRSASDAPESAPPTETEPPMAEWITCECGVHLRVTEFAEHQAESGHTKAARVSISVPREAVRPPASDDAKRPIEKS